MWLNPALTKLIVQFLEVLSDLLAGLIALSEHLICLFFVRSEGIILILAAHLTASGQDSDITSKGVTRPPLATISGDSLAEVPFICRI
jgi:hypothetical protein